MTDAPLKLFNSLTRQTEVFEPVHPGEARVYTCGPTVYNYPHIGNMRAYVFSDVLGRTLSWKGYKLTHVINITDVGHLTDDADAGEDKMEKMAAQQAQSIWDIAEHYKQAYWADVRALNIRQPAQWTVATDYVPQMIEFAKGIAEKHCYELESGLYFDVASVADYGRLAGYDHGKVVEEAGNAAAACLVAAEASYKAMLKAGKATGQFAHEISAAKQALEAVRASERSTRQAVFQKNSFEATRSAAATAAGASAVAAVAVAIGAGEVSTVLNLTSAAHTFGRIDEVEGKRNAADFAIWRKTPAGETRQMEWDSPWGKGAPGWHLECSVMSGAVLGFPFDIHTGGIDHREIHHPNEIAQNQAHCCTNGLDDPRNSGAKIWMHNNFLVERSGKMSKSSGEFLRLQLLIDRGYHPLAYRLMCLQAHYRSELEFSWEGLGAALTRLKRMVMAHEGLFTYADRQFQLRLRDGFTQKVLADVDQAMSEDLATPKALVPFELLVLQGKPKFKPSVDEPTRQAIANARLDAVVELDEIFGFGLMNLTRADLRIRPVTATITEAEIKTALARRKEARAAKDFAASDVIREELTAQGVEVMDGDPLGWEWKLG